MHPLRLDLGLCPQSFDPHALLQPWEKQHSRAATAVFIGRMRGQGSNGEALQAMELEHYPGMSEQQLEQLAQTISAREQAAAVLLRHRVGRVRPGEALVLVAVAAERRGMAQRCCQQLLEAIKHEAPFWKKEIPSCGEGHWVEANTAY